MFINRRSSAIEPASRPIETSRSAVYLLIELRASGALTGCQAERLRAQWPHRGDWATDPSFGTVREHTRAVIDHQRQIDLALLTKETA